MRKGQLLFLVLCCYIPVIAQPKIDSLDQLISSKPTIIAQSNLCFELFKSYVRNDPKTAKFLLDKGKVLALQTTDQKSIQMGISLSGQYFGRVGQGDSADYYYQKLIVLIDQNELLIDLGPVCINIGNHLRRKNKYAEAIRYANRAGTWFEEKGDHLGASKAHNNIGIIHRKLTNLDSALYHYKASLDNLDQISELSKSDKSSKGITLMNIGIVYAQMAIYDKAVYYFLESLKIKESIGDENGVARTYQNMGVLYNSMGDSEKSLEFYRKALQKAKEIQLFEMLGQVYNNIGNYYARSKQFDSALFYHELALENRKTYSNQRLIALSKNNLGNIYRDLGQYEKGLGYLFEALATRNSINDQFGIATSNQNIALIYQRTGRFNQAKFHLKIADSIASKMGIQMELVEIKQSFAELSSQLGDYQAAYKYQKQAAQIKDSINSREIDRKVFELEKKHELRDSENTIALRDAEILAKNYLIFGIGLVAILFAILVFVAISRSKHKSRSLTIMQEKNEKIETLMRELHHRVKNNLQVISSLLGLQSLKIADPAAKEAIEEGKSRVRAMSMIHQRLYQDRDIADIDFDDYAMELINELQKSYQSKQAIKLDINIPKVHFDVDTTLPLGLLINELITNAFKYAFEEIREPILKVELLKNEQDYQLVISDNGKGMEKEIDVSKAESFGLKLVNMLIKQMRGSLEMISDQGLTYRINFSPKV